MEIAMVGIIKRDKGVINRSENKVSEAVQMAIEIFRPGKPLRQEQMNKNNTMKILLIQTGRSPKRWINDSKLVASLTWIPMVANRDRRKVKEDAWQGKEELVTLVR